MKDLRDNVEDAVIAANDVIRQILTQSSLKVGHKPGEGPVTEADHAADEILFNKLNSLIDGSQWLSEESKQDTPLITGRPTWVVDPLDGTREFIRGLPEFGVSVGLFIEGNLSLGVIGLPKYSEEKGSIFSNNKLLIDGTVPKKIRENNILISRIGICTILRPNKIRYGSILDGKVGIFNLEDELSFLEVEKRNSSNISKAMKWLGKGS